MPKSVVEIALIWLASGVGNTISIRAKKTASGYTLSAVDEAGEKLKLKPTRIKAPLTNEQLLEAAKTLSWVPGKYGELYELREYESEFGEDAAEFITATSDVYPAFDAFVDADNKAWLEQKMIEWGADDEDDDQDE